MMNMKGFVHNFHYFITTERQRAIRTEKYFTENTLRNNNAVCCEKPKCSDFTEVIRNYLTSPHKFDYISSNKEQ